MLLKRYYKSLSRSKVCKVAVCRSLRIIQSSRTQIQAAHMQCAMGRVAELFSLIAYNYAAK